MDDMGERDGKVPGAASGLPGFYKYVPHALVRAHELEGWIKRPGLDDTHHGHHATLMFLPWTEDQTHG